MTVASFIASQRTEHGVPHALSCRALEVPESTFYKWHNRPPTSRHQRRAELDAAVKASFQDSGGTPGTYGSPRVWEDLIEAGWRVSKKTVAASMARQGLQGRGPKRKRRLLTRPDKAAAPIPDLVKRDFAAEAIDQRWCGDLTEIPTDEGKLYLATVLDLASRRLPGFAIGEHHDAPLAKAALCMAAAVRGGKVAGVSSTPTRAASTSVTCSPRRAVRSARSSRWAGSARLSTTLPRRASTRPSSSSSYRDGTSPPRTKHAGRSPRSSMPTTIGGATAPARCSRRSPTSRCSTSEPPRLPDRAGPRETGLSASAALGTSRWHRGTGE